MKKELPFLIIFFTILISMIFLAPFVSIPVFADGAFIDSVYPYSITFKLGTNIYIVQAKNPIFVNNSLGIYVNGDYKRIALSNSTVVETFATTSSYSAIINYSTILESSTDIYNYITREVVFQSEQTDNVVITEETIKTFYYLFGVLFGGIMSVTFSTSFKLGV